MCRKSCLYGCCSMCFGIGLIFGHCLESWLLCCGGGLILLVMGLAKLGSR